MVRSAQRGNYTDWDFSCLTGLFEVRAQEYLETLPSGEHSGVNKFLKGLGKAKGLSPHRQPLAHGSWPVPPLEPAPK